MNRLGRPLCLALVAMADVGAFAVDFDLGAFLGGLTAFATAIVGIYLYATRQINTAKIQNLKEWDAANKETLSGQIADMQHDLKEMRERVEDANKKLHEAKNEHQAERLRHNEEILRQTEEIKRLTGELRALRAEYRQLVEKFTAMDRKVDVNAGNLQRIADHAGSSSGIYPAVPNPAEELPRVPGD